MVDAVSWLGIARNSVVAGSIGNGLSIAHGD
jgi:hypothetical protein